MADILYRTNTFTGRTNPFSTPWYALAHDVTDENGIHGVLYCLARLARCVSNTLFDRVDNTNENTDYVVSLSVEQREAFYKEVFDALREGPELDLRVSCWFSTKDIVLSRANGYGKNICKENGGVLRCFDQGVEIYHSGFNTLRGYREEPKLTPDPLVSNKLISKVELDELLNHEEMAGRTLAQTCLKKDVLNVLKAARNGLIGDISPDYLTMQAVQDRIHDRMINDLL